MQLEARYVKRKDLPLYLPLSIINRGLPASSAAQMSANRTSSASTSSNRRVLPPTRKISSTSSGQKNVGVEGRVDLPRVQSTTDVFAATAADASTSDVSNGTTTTTTTTLHGSVSVPELRNGGGVQNKTSTAKRPAETSGGGGGEKRRATGGGVDVRRDVPDLLSPATAHPLPSSTQQQKKSVIGLKLKLKH
uniref:Uncharacterized protein n=1 Tax=Romanomermis culicivorax TaxID=13658 RepID=A0A915IN18_ROMCU